MKYNFIDRFYYEYLSLFSTAFKTITRNLKNKKFESEVEILHKFINPGDVCFDVGGAYGRYALPMSIIAGKTGRVFSFEPGNYSYKVLSIVKWFHRLKNVSIHKLALCDKDGLTNLCLPAKKTGKIGASLAFISAEEQDNAVSEPVKTTTIDHFCRENRINGVNFIKCDTEGSELLVFKGAKNTLEAYRPVILAEVDAGNMRRYGYGPVDLEDFFKTYKYKIFAYDNGKFINSQKIVENGNYFFISEEKTSIIQCQNKI